SGVCGTPSSGASAVASWAGSAGRISDRNLAKKRSARVVSGRICLADGSISFVRTCRIPMVSSLAAAIFDVGLDVVNHPLDCEHFPDLRYVALAHTWASVGVASWLDNAACIRMCCDSCRNYRFAPDPTVARAPMLNGVGSVKDSSPNSITVSGSLTPSSYTAFVQFTEEWTL